MSARIFRHFRVCSLLSVQWRQHRAIPSRHSAITSQSLQFPPPPPGAPIEYLPLIHHFNPRLLLHRPSALELIAGADRLNS